MPFLGVGLGVLLGWFCPVWLLIVLSVIAAITFIYGWADDEKEACAFGFFFLVALWVTPWAKGYFDPKTETVTTPPPIKQVVVDPIPAPEPERGIETMEVIKNAFEFFAGLFVVGTVGFWLLLVASGVMGCITIRKEWNWAAGGTGLVTVLCLYFGGNSGIFRAISIGWLIGCILIYVASGIVVSYWKFNSWLARRRRKIDEAVDRFCDDHLLPARTIPKEKEGDYNRHLKNFLGLSEREKVRPRYWECKGRIVFWGSMWVWVLAEILFVNMFIRVYEYAYYHLEGFGKWMIEHHFKDIDQFLPENERTPKTSTQTSASPDAADTEPNPVSAQTNPPYGGGRSRGW